MVFRKCSISGVKYESLGEKLCYEDNSEMKADKAQVSILLVGLLDILVLSI